MTSFLMKIIVCPLGVIVSDWLFANVYFATYYQAIGVGLIIAVVGAIMEFMVLRKGTLWISTFLDFVAATLIVYFVSNLFAGTVVTFTGAILTGVVLGVVEHFTHVWLIRSGKTQKTAY